MSNQLNGFVNVKAIQYLHAAIKGDSSFAYLNVDLVINILRINWQSVVGY